MLHNRKRWWLVALLVAATIWCFVDVRQRGYLYPECPEEHRTDLTVYTASGRAFLDGGQPYEVANPRGWTYLYPPMLALMLAPLDVLPTQDQVTVWFFISLLFCWGCWRECRRIVTIVCDEDASVAAAWARWSPWLAVAAVTAALIPTLNCLQRGQVSILKFYFSLLGLRLILGGRTYRAWLAGGVALALPIVLKILPLVQVGFLLFLQLLDLVATFGKQQPVPEPVRRRFAASTWGVALGLALFLLFIPAMLIGWRANLHHLDTWGRFMLTKADDGGMDPRSGNSHTTRNQSLHNAAYRLGNFAAYIFADGHDDRVVERVERAQDGNGRPRRTKALAVFPSDAGPGFVGVGRPPEPRRRQPIEPRRRLCAGLCGHAGRLARGAGAITSCSWRRPYCWFRCGSIGTAGGGRAS